MGEKRPGNHLIWEYISEHLGRYVFAIMLVVMANILATLIPRIIGEFTDTFDRGELDARGAAHFGLLILGIGVIRVILAWKGRFYIAQNGRILVYKFREKLFKKWETLPSAYYHGHSVGELLSHALSDVEALREVVTLGINAALNSVVMLAGSFYVMFVFMNWKLALAGLAPLVAIPVIVRYYGPRIKRQSAQLQASLGLMSQSVEEYVGGIRTIKAFGNKKVIVERFGKDTDRIVQQRMKLVRLSSVFSAIIPFIASVGFIVVIGYGGYLTITKEITLGNFVTFLLYLILLKHPLEMLGNVINVYQRGAASLARLAELLDAPVAVSDREGISSHKSIEGEIEVKSLAFRYPGTDQDVLTDISFKVKKGQTLGIIGAIGSGKTTLAHLFTRVYDPPEGSIFIDGIDIHEYYLEDVRNSVSFVPQSGFLFSTTIAANIAFADKTIAGEKVRDAASTSAIHEHIGKLAEKYKTEIGERGVRLSGGQRQRVAIARAIYKAAPINIFDDSLSAVDTKTERAILENLQASGKDRTNIIISHRLSAVMGADEIIILDAGRIVERGTHQHLLQTSEHYGKLWNLQAGIESKSEKISIDEPAKEDLVDELLSETDDEI